MGGAPRPVLSTTLDLPGCEARAWVVVDSLVDGLAMGGTRMTPTVTEAELAHLARAMTRKLALVGLPIGGAKAGIAPGPGAPGTGAERQAVMREFGRSAGPLLHGGVYLGCDQGTTYADRRLAFEAAGYDVAERPGATRLTVGWAELWDHMADITGYGVAVAVLGALRAAGARTPRRIAIQGFGTVGRAVAGHLADRGHRVVAVADVHGTIEDPRGLPVAELTALTSGDGTIDRTRLPASATVRGPGRAWLHSDADVLVLAASAAAIDTDAVPSVRAPMVVEGGNMSCTEPARRLLRERGHTVLPDVVVNVGGAAATGCVLTGLAPSDLPLPRLSAWLRAWVAERVARNCELVQELSTAGSPDPVAELLTAPPLRRHGPGGR
ncbi:Glu/Leu/Phe/Val dehydrogenase dimerization domain-containing protein [Streptomyces clavuligerus]|uniref:Glu/Leu/Phe/Val dehydrogenase dimerization domain-containing protein n=1 Tax=Streptomyces clavuligerus TaxID=1901 RepID=UPI00018009E2|nr:Glu/Leu/Phe/Val dehydrogenase dimerization domain-containing protein [Streptomyces clavuligerus]EDY52413.1 glutamate dehydrogenase [Streptomyces clavuligerus]MBY6306774.1 Glu/Leu/Phe/Val dehydrogenase [Streptomyces clavuligerus]QCS10623.1 Glu/Leu/Phe/Val dehydrogenase [Streptomyces clavuligerus]QPJ97339.1 Glu/Leu/Phe/Val dehydrogenase [Streptomyces clavuligerus]WDN57333.1 Glu/Leu/Phe/Val dehydrogenase [Streptomyces clavuligerus]